MRVSIAGLYRLAPFLLYSAKLSSAYFIHSSCEGKDIDRGKLVQAIESAFYFAVDALYDWDNGEVQDLKSWIFGSNVDKAKQFYVNIFSDNSIFSENKDPNALLTDKIVFFCTTDTLRVRDDPIKNNPKNKSGKLTLNTAVNIETYGDVIKQCVPESGVSGTKALTGRHESDGRSYIMFCSWYLQRMNVVKLSTAKALTSMLRHPLRTLDKGLDKIIPLDGDKTGMDTMSLLDQTILHEITHTEYAGHAEDIDGLNSYNWKNVIRLSAHENGWKNAESLAFFGLATNLTAQGYTITKEGDVKGPKK
ncbi:hypothetical protein M434DRAFT_394976 [Hypoxylon sp. CO27-5]|nr:hypothetical protein M434DRAFT_394976 [Hypoxylon sp. CO27-5]